MTYPIKIRLSKGAIDELQICEEASNTYLICQRHKTVLEIRDQEEAVEVFNDVCFGTFQLITEYRNRLRSARKIANALRPHVPESIRNRFPAGKLISKKC